ncbi:MAG TPA: hypothetical protein PK867_13310 [Pirellulales bacterium]|nr:hypothetical protein [Pirellulales bacterium]
MSQQLEQQKQRFDQVIDEIIRDPDNADLRCEVGEMLLDQGKRKEAYTWFVSARTARTRRPTPGSPDIMPSWESSGWPRNISPWRLSRSNMLRISHFSQPLAGEGNGAP